MYDPLLESSLNPNQSYPNSYWASTVDSPTQEAPLSTQQSSEVVIIGAGYTGLSCAYHLAKLGIESTILEANKTGWGCSGRNAGFVLRGSGRLGYAQLSKRFGVDIAEGVMQEFQAGVETVANLIEEGNIECDVQESGYYKVAHSKRWIAPLQQQAKSISAFSNNPVRWIEADEFKQHHINHHNAEGALFFSDNFGINPLKLAKGYQQLCQDKGVNTFLNSPVRSIESNGSVHRVITDGGSINCKHVVIASNGYTSKDFHPHVDNKTLPVLSSIIVTQPFDEQTLHNAGIFSTAVAMDTRSLKYYYRRLPDGRILFGGRGAITGKNADHAIFRNRLLSALKQTFPALPVPNIDYAWSGWISVSLDDIPRIYSHQNNVHYAMGYCGSGVSFSAQSGKRLAERIAKQNKSEFELPFFTSPLPTFPMASMRRIGQWGFYHLGRFTDAL